MNNILGTKSRGNTLNLLRPGGTEHESLPFRAFDEADDFLDVLFETHVKHPIGFVERKEGAPMHIRLVTIQQVH